jgi:hypothetical protein
LAALSRSSSIAKVVRTPNPSPHQASNINRAMEAKPQGLRHQVTRRLGGNACVGGRGWLGWGSRKNLRSVEHVISHGE